MNAQTFYDIWTVVWADSGYPVSAWDEIHGVADGPFLWFTSEAEAKVAETYFGRIGQATAKRLADVISEAAGASEDAP